MKFFGRKYELTLKDPSGGDVTFTGGLDNQYGLDIEFDIEWVGSSNRKGTISIVGLSLERIAKYVSLSCLDSSRAASRKLRATLKAGYDDPGMVDIIDGFVVTGRQSRPPEIRLTMEVDENYNSYDGMFEVGVSTPTKKSDVISALLDPFGVSFNVEKNAVNMDKSVFNENITLESRYRDFFTTREKVISLAGPNITCRENGGAMWLIGQEKSTPVPIGKENGLLSVDGITIKGLDVTMFLQDYGGPLFPYVTVESDFNSHANDTYRVTGKHFRGQFRGNTWATTYQCQRVTLD